MAPYRSYFPLCNFYPIGKIGHYTIRYSLMWYNKINTSERHVRSVAAGDVRLPRGEYSSKRFPVRPVLRTLDENKREVPLLLAIMASLGERQS